MAAQDAAKNGNLPSTEEMQKIFDQFDINKDGKISIAELSSVLQSMGSNYPQEELQRVMDELDTDRDGFIDPTEFAAICRTSADAATAAAELRDAFDLYDHDKNGLISNSELHQVLNQLGMKCTADDCAKMIKSVDMDGDGCVNFQEFKKMMCASNGGSAPGF